MELWTVSFFFFLGIIFVWKYLPFCSFWAILYVKKNYLFISRALWPAFFLLWTRIYSHYMIDNCGGEFSPFLGVDENLGCSAGWARRGAKINLRFYDHLIAQRSRQNHNPVSSVSSSDSEPRQRFGDSDLPPTANANAIKDTYCSREIFPCRHCGWRNYTWK